MNLLPLLLILFTSKISLLRGEDPSTTTTTEKGTEKNTKPPEVNSTLWDRWNEIGNGTEETWLTKYCPKELFPDTGTYAKFCIIHCWWNGWQGGFCTEDSICVCAWENLVEVTGATPMGKATLPPSKGDSEGTTKSSDGNGGNGNGGGPGGGGGDGNAAGGGDGNAAGGGDGNAAGGGDGNAAGGGDDNVAGGGGGDGGSPGTK